MVGVSSAVSLPLTPKKSSKYIQRKSVEDEFKAALKHHLSPTVLVFGGRGNGKSTVIRNVLAKHDAVIEINAKNLDEVTEAICREIHKSLPANVTSLKKALLASPVSATILVSVNFDTPGETLRQLVQYSKGISYDAAETHHQPRIILEISNSRAAIEGRLSEEEFRIKGVEVGPFSRGEALLFVTPRIPTCLEDERRRKQLAERIVEKYDLKPTWLQEVCENLNCITSGDVKDFENAIDNHWASKVADAELNWEDVCTYIMERTKDLLSDEDQAEVIKDLKKKLNSKTVVRWDEIRQVMNSKGPSKLLFSDFTKMNAKTEGTGHIFYIHPFKRHIGWNGKAAKQGANKIST
mmetsp:Transcript_2416/g.5325  ORF Transcript_2416/g.5325 Transcript_2416/m.5325 type:complete len:352 (-) Transcript_2416:75-1130(-)